MEAVDDQIAAPPGLVNKDLSPIAKGKRTKRHRPHSPISFTINALDIDVTSSEDSTTTEEEDTAKCLILLSRGHFINHPPPDKNNDNHYFINSKHKKSTQTTVAAKAAGGACMYTCKTCDRSFASFQALGGHRASHKKPKNEKKLTMFDEDFPSPSSNSLSLQLSNISTSTNTFSKSSPSPRVHVCSYCGAEFTSGQALGGHMRRHRGGPISPSLNSPIPDESKNLRNILSLDLNLPAPEDENQRFGFAGSMKQVDDEAAVRLGLSTTTTASTLVDCHF